MPTLNWIGKDAVRHHHREIPFRLLKANKTLSVGDPETGNLLVQGDNLHALKALLPRYAGQVRCIYIDPPYNTGNEGWVYNDAVNSPEMKAWLGEVVGKETEDLSRHDKWLCMMYPRLQLLKRFLSQDGAIFVSIDDKEAHHLRNLLDEVFGPQNFVATIIWQKVYAPKNSARHFSEDHDYVVVYAKDADRWRPNLVERSEKQDKAYKNPDADPRGPWKTSDLSARNFYSKGTYAITCPSGRVIAGPPTGRYWTIEEAKLRQLDSDNRIWWGKKRNAIPQLKRFLSETKQGVVPQTLWTYQEVGHSQEAKKELLSIVSFESSDDVFVTPKPLRMMRRILAIGADKDSLVMDSFAGSGTFAHAAMAMNAEDGGTRQFVLVEMDERIAKDITAQRLTKAIKGYQPIAAREQERVEGAGGGFTYCTLGDPLFDELGSVRPDVRFSELANHVFFSETGLPMPRAAKASPLLGIHEDTAVYLLFNGILGDHSHDGGNMLTPSVLAALPDHDGPKVIYAEGCRVSETRLRRERIVFKQTPYQIKVN